MQHYFLTVQYETTSPEATTEILEALQTIAQHQVDTNQGGVLTYLFTRPHPKESPTKIEFTELYFNQTAFFEHAKASHLSEPYLKMYNPKLRKTQETYGMGFEGKADNFLRKSLEGSLQAKWPEYDGYMVNEDLDLDSKDKTPLMMKLYLKPLEGDLKEFRKEISEALSKYKESSSLSLLIYERNGEIHIYETFTHAPGLLNQLQKTDFSFLKKCKSSDLNLYGEYSSPDLKKQVESMNFSTINFGQMDVGYILHPQASFETIKYSDYTVSLGPKIRRHPDFENEYFGQIKYWMKKQNIKVNDKDKYNKTMLFYACESNYQTVAEFLLKEGATIECDDYQPLCMACQHYNMGMINLLLDHGAKVNVKDYEENSPLHLALRIAKDDEKIIQLLDLFSKKDLDLNMKDHDGDSFLHLSTRYGLLWASAKLIEMGCSLEAKNNIGNTVFLNCCENSWGWNMHCFRLIQQKGGNFKATNEDGNNALHLAARNGLIPIVKFLSKKISMDSLNNHGNTPLMEACLNNRNVTVIQHLISYKMNLEIQNNSNLTALELALKNYNLDVCYVLMARLKRKEVIESLSHILPTFSDVDKEMEAKKINLDKIEKDLERK
jgi:ankyrin repeat protein/quinol monooxygenase YgiN